MSSRTCSSCKKRFDAKDIRNNLCEKCLAVKVVKHWLKSDKVRQLVNVKNTILGKKVVTGVIIDPNVL